MVIVSDADAVAASSPCQEAREGRKEIVHICPKIRITALCHRRTENEDLPFVRV